MTEKQIWEQAAKGHFGKTQENAAKQLVANLIYVPLTN